MAQRFNGIEPGGQPGRKCAKENSHEARHRDCNEGCQKGHGNVHVGKKAQRKWYGEPYQRADDSAHQRNHHRFREELHLDLDARGANRLTNPNLADARRDRSQHDVHDADTSDDQCDYGE